MFAAFPTPGRTLFVRVVIVVCIVLLTTGCGGNDSPGVEVAEGTDPAAWSRTVCTSLQAWIDDLKNRSIEHDRRMHEAESPVEARSATVDFYADQLAIADDFLRDLDQAGSPAIEGGAKAAQSFRRGFLIVRTELVKARERARDLPNDRANFIAMNNRIAESLEAAYSRMHRYFEREEERLTAPELDRIFRRTAKCQLEE
jgi:hypothetical protein